VLAAAAFVPLAAWGAHFALMRGLAPLLCGPPASVWLYVLTAALLLVVLVAGIYAGRGYLAAEAQRPARSGFGRLLRVRRFCRCAQAAVFGAACVA